MSPAKQKRDHPFLASDVARSYIALCVFLLPTGTIWYVLDSEHRTTLGDDGVTYLTVFFGWSILSILLVALAVAVFQRAGASELRRWLTSTTPPATGLSRFWWACNGGGGTYWALTGSSAAIIAVILIAINDQVRREPVLIAAVALVVISSLAVIIVSFAVRYAREDSTRGGAAFPGTAAPRFGDYLYFAIQVSTTFASSDVSITTPGMRRLVAVHSLVAFGFNTVIVALMVSVFVSTATTR